MTVKYAPKMRTLSDTIRADIHGNVASGFHSLESLFHARDNRNESFDAIRPGKLQLRSGQHTVDHGVTIDSILVSQSRVDMTCDNVL